jgi:serine-threonine kinase receptor-associated protein
MSASDHTTDSSSAPSSTPSTSTKSDSGPIICPGHSRPVPDLSFSLNTNDGYFLISSCLDNKSMIREGATGDWIGTFRGHKGAVWCARLNNSATQAATAAADFSAKLWDALTGAELHTLQHKHIVKSLAFSADGTKLYTGGHEKRLRIYDLNRIDADPTLLDDHKANITGVWTIGSDEQIIISAGAEKDIRCWDRRTGNVVRRLPTTGEVRYCQTSMDGKVLSVSITGKEVAFFNTEDMKLIKAFQMPREIDSISFDPVNQRFVTVSKIIKKN